MKGRKFRRSYRRGLLTVGEFSKEIKKSNGFTYSAIRLGKLDAEKVGGQYFLLEGEAERFKAAPFTITRKEVS